MTIPVAVDWDVIQQIKQETLYCQLSVADKY